MASFRWYIGASFTASLIAVAALAVARSSAEGVRDARLGSGACELTAVCPLS